MQLRQHDVEQWMTHRRLSTELRKYVSLNDLYNHKIFLFLLMAMAWGPPFFG